MLEPVDCVQDRLMQYLHWNFSVIDMSSANEINGYLFAALDVANATNPAEMSLPSNLSSSITSTSRTAALDISSQACSVLVGRNLYF